MLRVLGEGRYNKVAVECLIWVAEELGLQIFFKDDG